MKKLVATMMGFTMMAGTAAQAQSLSPIVKDGVGIRITENFNRFLESQLTNRDLAFQKDVISKTNVSCFDEVGIRNLDVTTHIDNAAFDWNGATGGLSVVVNLGDLMIAGDLYGKDGQFFDLCPS